MNRIGVLVSVLLVVGCGNGATGGGDTGGGGEGGAASSHSTAAGEAGHGSNGGSDAGGQAPQGGGGSGEGGTVTIPGSEPGIPDTGYVGSVKLQDIGVANYATFVLVDGKAKYWGYAIGGGITIHPSNIPAPDGVTLARISAGGHSNLALDTEGKVWAAGGDIMGEMGIGRVGGLHEFFTSWVQTPTDDEGHPFDHVVEVQSGFNGSSALKDDGSLWFWGLNGEDGTPATSPGNGGGYSGVCGVASPTTGCPWGGDPHADPNCYITRPHRIPLPNKGNGSPTVIVKYELGLSTPVALDDEGDVWTWGSQALKNGNFGQTSTPVKVPIPLLPAGEKIVQITAASSFFLALGSNNHVYGWARGVGGTFLGIGDGNYNWHPTPTPIDVTAQPGFTDLVGKIKALYSCNQATYVLDTDDNVWSWGSQVVGSVGNGPTGISQGIGIDHADSWNWSTTVDLVMKPTKVLSNVAAFFTRGYTYNAFAVTRDGKFYGWGRDKFDNMGDGCVGDTEHDRPDACDVGTPKSVTPL